jgi:hypothetical protein
MRPVIRWTIALTIWIAPFAAFAQDSVAAQEKTVPGGTLAMITYIVFIALMLGYLALLSWRQRKLDRDIEGLERRLDELAELE